MEPGKEVNGLTKSIEDVASGQYTAVPTSAAGSGDRAKLIPTQATDHASGSSAESGTEVSPLQMELGKGVTSCRAEGLKVIIISSISFSVAITMALILTIYFGPPQVAPHGAVSCDAAVCASVGEDILKKGGSSVDAAIAIALCQGVVYPFSSGIGGGGFMIVRDNKKDLSLVIDFRETAPENTSPDLYESDPKTQHVGPMAAGVPGMLRGLEAAHKKFGKLPWKELFQPAIRLANETGFNVTKHFMDHYNTSNWKTEDSAGLPNLHQFLMQLNRFPQLGDTLYHRNLARVLEAVAVNGTNVFYEGDFAKNFVKEVTSRGGIFTLNDLKSYKVVMGPPVEDRYMNMTVQTVGPPAAGSNLIMMLNILEALLTNHINKTEALGYHLFIEAQKFAFGEKGHLGDPAFSEDVENVTARMISKTFAAALAQKVDFNTTHRPQYYAEVLQKITGRGTSHISVLGPDEFMVAMTLSLNGDWGSKFMTSSGIILNAQMSDFSVGHSPYNIMEPGKRPASNMAPTLLFSRKKPCGIRMALGGAGGDYIPAGVADVLTNILVYHKSLEVGIGLRRVYASLDPDVVLYEIADKTSTYKIAPKIIQFQRDLGHNMTQVPRLSSVNAVAKINETLFAQGDPRIEGSGAVY